MIAVDLSAEDKIKSSADITWVDKRKSPGGSKRKEPVVGRDFQVPPTPPGGLSQNE